MLKHRFALSLVLSLVAEILVAKAQVPEKIRNPKSDESNEASVVEQYTHRVKFENDGTSTQEESARVRIQSEAGVQRLSACWPFRMPAAPETFAIEYVRVRKVDGTTVETTPDSIQDMPAEITRQAPFYSDLREKHVAVKGLGIGDVLEYKTVSRVTKPLVPGQFWLDYSFARDSIFLQDQLEVSVPRERAIKWISPDTKPTVSEAGPYRVYNWSRSNLERINKNEKIEQAKTNWEQGRGRFPHPDVQLSSFQSWDELGRWYRDLQADRVKLSPEILAKAVELTKGAADEDAKLRAIYNYVSTQFRYIGIAFGVGRYQPHFASEVLANQYGDCKDKHTLLAALLNAVGIKAYPALISTEREMDAQMPSPSQFNHVITAIPRGSNLLWLDTTAEVGPFQFLIAPLRDKHALVIWDDKPATLVNTPAHLPFPSSQAFHMEAKLDDNGTLVGNAEFTCRGDIEFLLRSAFRSTAMPQWKELAQRISMNLGFAGEVSEVNASSPEKTDNPFHLSYKYLRKEFGDWPNRRILAPSPAIGLPLMNSDLASLPVPLWLGEPVEVTSHSQVEIPKGYSIDVPAPIQLKRDFAEYDVTYSFKDGKLICDRHLRTLVSELHNSSFSDFEKFSKTVQNDYQSFIQLASDRPSRENQFSAENTLLANSIQTLPDSSNQEALRLAEEGRQAFGRQDVQTAISSLYRSVTADPRFVRAWVILGELLMAMHQTDSGMDAFQKAIAADPQQPVTHKLYAISLGASLKFTEAVPAWQAYIKLAPEDADGPAYLGAALMELKRDRRGRTGSGIGGEAESRPRELSRATRKGLPTRGKRPYGIGRISQTSRSQLAAGSALSIGLRDGGSQHGSPCCSRPCRKIRPRRGRRLHENRLCEFARRR